MSQAPLIGGVVAPPVVQELSDQLHSRGQAVAASRRIALLISSLNYGGAEMQATVLANGLARSGHNVSLLVFYAGGPLRDRLASDVRVRLLGRRGRWDVSGLLRGLFSALGEERPDVLYAFLPGCNLLACLGKLRLPKLRLMWGVRASYMDLRRDDWVVRFSYWLESRFSRWPHLIIANSVAGRRHAVLRGFHDDDHFIVIPNGIDVEYFRPDPGLRAALRSEWGVLPGQTLLGMVARLDPMKDYPSFLEAAGKLARRKNDLRFVSVGSGRPDYAALLQQQARGLGLGKKMIWAGPRSDLPAVYNALDLLVSSSVGEGFSNVLGEAMACGVPCVATDVGDARSILGEDGAVVPPRDPEALSRAMLASLERFGFAGSIIGARLRQRVIDNFSVDTLVRRTSEALEAIP